PPPTDQPCEERGFSHARLRLNDEVAAVVILNKTVYFALKPIPTDKAVGVYPFEHLPGSQVGVSQRFVASHENWIVIAGDDEISDGMTTNGDAAGGVRLSASRPRLAVRCRQLHRPSPAELVSSQASHDFSSEQIISLSFMSTLSTRDANRSIRLIY